MFIATVPEDVLIVLVTGDRNWSDRESMFNVLARLSRDTIIVHGAARGADMMADGIAAELGLQTIPCPSHWRHNDPKWVIVHGPCDIDCKQVVGAAAGAIRNHWMLDTYHPRRVIAFHTNLYESRGTGEMVEYALRKKVPTYLCDGYVGIARVTAFKRKILMMTKHSSNIVFN